MKSSQGPPIWDDGAVDWLASCKVTSTCSALFRSITSPVRRCGVPEPTSSNEPQLHEIYVASATSLVGTAASALARPSKRVETLILQALQRIDTVRSAHIQCPCRPRNWRRSLVGK